MEENIYIPLLEEHKELPSREAVLSRFRQAFFLRLEQGSRRAEEVPVERLLQLGADTPVSDEEAPPEEAAFDEQEPQGELAPLLFSMDEPEEPAPAEDNEGGGLFGEFEEGETTPEEGDLS